MEVKDRTGLHMDLRDAAASSKYRREAGDQADSAAQYARQAQSSARQAEDCLDAAAEAVSHYPRIGGEYWQVWDAERGEYVSTGIMAQGPRGEIGPRGDPGPGPNRNLLDNWYFVGGGSQRGDGIFPINQRGQQSYELGSGQYGIDRWRASGSGLTESLQSDGVVFGVNGQTANRWFRYAMPTTLPAGKYTFSVLVTEITVPETGDYVSIGIGRGASVFAERVQISEPGLYTVTSETAVANSVLISFVGGKDASIKISAIKVELGDTQTLAHQEGGEWALNELPDYGEELAKCQRYYWAIGPTSGQAYPTYSLGIAYKTGSCQFTFVHNFAGAPSIKATNPRVSQASHTSGTDCTLSRVIYAHGVTIIEASTPGITAGTLYRLTAEGQLVFEV